MDAFSFNRDRCNNNLDFMHTYFLFSFCICIVAFVNVFLKANEWTTTTKKRKDMKWDEEMRTTPVMLGIYSKCMQHTHISSIRRFAQPLQRHFIFIIKYLPRHRHSKWRIDSDVRDSFFKTSCLTTERTKKKHEIWRMKASTDSDISILSVNFVLAFLFS